MEGSGSIGFDLTGTIAQYRQEIKRIRNELTEREADLAALERVQTIKVREMGLDRVERVEPKVMAFHIGRYMKDHAVDTITPKDALSIVGNAPFFDGLADQDEARICNPCAELRGYVSAGRARRILVVGGCC